MRHVVVVLLSLVVVAPAAAATSFVAELSFEDAPTLDGAVRASASEGALDLGDARGVAMTFASATGWLVGQELDHVVAGEAEVYSGTRTTNRSLHYGQGTLSRVECADGCRALLVSAGAGEVALSGDASGAWALLAEERVYAFGSTAGPERDGFLYRAPPGAVAVGAGGLPMAGAEAEASGDLLLFLRNATMLVEAGPSSERLDARTSSEPTTGPLGVQTGRREVARFLVLHLDGARLAPSPAPGALLLAREPALVVEGALASASASGVVRVGNERRVLDAQRFEVEGAFLADPRAARDALAVVRGPTGEASLEGDATRLVAGAEPLAAPAVPSGVVAAGAVGVGAIALFVLWHLGLIPFYTRLEAASLLRNPNRRRVHEWVSTNSGATTQDLVRGLSMSEVVVRHHLRILEQHGFIVARDAGRLRGYFPVGRASPELAALTLLLRDETRRRIAEAVACAAAPLSQADIAGVAGISPRLVSYHLGKLERDGLVDSEGSQPRRYLATSRLSSFVADTAMPAAA